MLKYLVYLLLLIIPEIIVSQELYCSIQVMSQKIQGTNRRVFEALQTDLYEFINNKKWTNHVYTNDERIECSLLFNLEEQIGDQFKGSLTIQSNRPVFNSSYNTVIINFVDNDLDFRYVEFQPLEFNENSHLSNLTSIVAYYIYIIIGMDYDSFSLEGGTEFFQKAEQIVNNAQNAPEKGWKAYENTKNRYWLIENIMNNKYRSIRTFIYNYHRLGLDLMVDKPTDGRSVIAESLTLLQKVYREKPAPFMPFFKLVVDAKSDEFINIFSESFPDEKNRVYNILTEIDPANSNKYKKIIKSE